jgi:hypothetical protein
MVAAKAPLIKMAIGTTHLPIEVLEDRIRFDWFAATNDNGQIDCWAQFIARLCITASGKARVTAREREFVNPRYQMRCFCLALGMIGPQFAATRKLLCSNLPGNSGWLAPPEQDAGIRAQEAGDDAHAEVAGETLPGEEDALEEAPVEAPVE